METYINLIVQIVFAAVMVVVVVYSIIALYALNTYGLSKSITLTLSTGYLSVMVFLMGWAWVVLGKL